MGQWKLAEEPEYFVGLDLGKCRDHTAVAVIERAHVVFPEERDAITMDFRRETWHTLRHLERAPLMTPYPDVVGLVKRVVCDPGLRGKATLVVDATGVGEPVVDLLRAEGLPARLMPLTITGGEAGVMDSSSARAPKRELVVGLQVAFQKRWLKIAKRMRLTDALLEELFAMRMRVSASGHERYGAGTGHDDLVMAVALAWWQVRSWWPGRARCGEGRVV